MGNIVLLSADPQGRVAARMPYAVKSAGMGAWIVCPSSSMMRLSNYIDGGRLFKVGTHVANVARAVAEVVEECAPDAIIPCDDFALAALDVFVTGNDESAIFQRTRQLVRTWIGADAGLRLRSRSVECIRRLGMRIPRQSVVDPDTVSSDDFETCSGPMVVKMDHTCGGAGTVLAATPEQAVGAAKALGHGRAAHAPHGRIVVQDFVPGTSASVSFAALEGKVLDAFSYVIVKRCPEPFGASSVIDLVHHEGLHDLTRRIVEHFSYSGFGGIDFILPDDQGAPVFLEINPRQTRTTHLATPNGGELCRAMASALGGAPYTVRRSHAGAQTVALFPHEWLRDQDSPYLSQSHYDVPWYEPRITAASLAA